MPGDDAQELAQGFAKINFWFGQDNLLHQKRCPARLTVGHGV
jgi:hypothetical protein